ncbi:hypothetical protein CANARDRAFT_28760 [[Candida] arabinofermentans NRRL YB-2248]|uniref:FAM192A/Fyv6 N-terminal domain-containing protein n=1 Tax=[Candida] arabinofermentans NRRL YB-2248 TaxID=983967 RepID=A0A1E4SZW4_9ASCO|nr:hypothetical protein CANARDRAFT_28760 [[Candida] arabinofermentans NRRL YB-2248]
MSSKFVEAGEATVEQLAVVTESGESLMDELNQESNKPQRKSLAQQLRDNRTRIYKEFKEKMESTNSSYKLRNSDLDYYAKLEMDKLKEQEEWKKQEGSQLQEFKRQKLKQSTNSLKPHIHELLDDTDHDIVISRKSNDTHSISGVLKKKKKIKTESSFDIKEEPGHDSDDLQSHNQHDVPRSSIEIKTEASELLDKQLDGVPKLDPQTTPKVAAPSNTLNLGYGSSSDEDSD